MLQIFFVNFLTSFLLYRPNKFFFKRFFIYFLLSTAMIFNFSFHELSPVTSINFIILINVLYLLLMREVPSKKTKFLYSQMISFLLMKVYETKILYQIFEAVDIRLSVYYFDFIQSILLFFAILSVFSFIIFDKSSFVHFNQRKNILFFTVTFYYSLKYFILLLHDNRTSEFFILFLIIISLISIFGSKSQRANILPLSIISCAIASYSKFFGLDYILLFIVLNKIFTKRSDHYSFTILNGARLLFFIFIFIGFIFSPKGGSSFFVNDLILLFILSFILRYFLKFIKLLFKHNQKPYKTKVLLMDKLFLFFYLIINFVIIFTKFNYDNHIILDKRIIYLTPFLFFISFFSRIVLFILEIFKKLFEILIKFSTILKISVKLIYFAIVQYMIMLKIKFFRINIIKKEMNTIQKRDLLGFDEIFLSLVILIFLAIFFVLNF